MSNRQIVDVISILAAWRHVALQGMSRKAAFVKTVSKIGSQELQHFDWPYTLGSSSGSRSAPPTPTNRSSTSQANSFTDLNDSKSTIQCEAQDAATPKHQATARPADQQAPAKPLSQDAVVSKEASSLDSSTDNSPMRNIVEEIKQEIPEVTRQLRVRDVPKSRAGRFLHFGGLAFGLGAGAIGEAFRRATGSSELQGTYLLSEANVRRIVNKLTQLRGAALKVGQILSIQNTEILPKPVEKILLEVQNAANYIPVSAMEKAMAQQLGPDWRSKYQTFDDEPFAAASIGQVHKAVTLQGRRVAVKLQYPGISNSIDSDLSNLKSLILFSGVLPKGLYLDHTIQVARKELMWETNYNREADAMERFQALLDESATSPEAKEGKSLLLEPFAARKYRVPVVERDLCATGVLTTELVSGVPLGDVEGLSQEIRNSVAERVMALVLQELFDFRFMQTDPNWGNFLYNIEEDVLYLLDFGSAREFGREFTDPYMEVLRASANADGEGIRKYSEELGFLTGEETLAMTNAHVDAVMTLGRPFRFDVYDFGEAKNDITNRVRGLIPTMLEERLTPPPDESYSLHRKLSGLFLLCSKLKARTRAKQLFWEASERYKSSSSCTVSL